MKRKFKKHLFRSTRSTWCGHGVDMFKGIPAEHVTRDRREVTCRTCLKADAAEQRKQDAASATSNT